MRSYLAILDLRGRTMVLIVTRASSIFSILQIPNFSGLHWSALISKLELHSAGVSTSIYFCCLGALCMISMIFLLCFLKCFLVFFSSFPGFSSSLVSFLELSLDIFSGDEKDILLDLSVPYPFYLLVRACMPPLTLICPVSTLTTFILSNSISGTSFARLGFNAKWIGKLPRSSTLLRNPGWPWQVTFSVMWGLRNLCY